MQKEKLFTKNYIFACAANFLNCLGFFTLLPTLPILLIEKYGILQSQAGIILASYAFAAMLARPFSAYFSDLYNRKTILCGFLAVYSLLFLPYAFLTGVAAFIALRAVHGIFFGGETVCANALVTDIVCESRRGEGFGYFGVCNNLAMALGPMVGLYIHEFTGGFLWVSITAFLFCAAGFLCILEIHLSPEQKKAKPTENKGLSLDKLFQPKGIYAGIALLFISYPWGFIFSFSAIYGKKLGISGAMGAFFAFVSAGLVASRLFSGKLVDKGKITAVIQVGSFAVSVILALFAAIGFIKLQNGVVLQILFYIIGLLIGVGYGIMFPAYNALFVNLSPDNRRAAASSTYLTSWDIGLGLGLIFGTIIAQKYSYSYAYAVCAVSSFVSALFFTAVVSRHFNKYKLR